MGSFQFQGSATINLGNERGKYKFEVLLVVWR